MNTQRVGYKLAQMSRFGIVLILALVFLLFVIAVRANMQTFGLKQGSDPDSGLKFWQWKADGVLFELTQRLPDQTWGFFEARGFDPIVADEIARACVFQSNFKNTAAPGGGSIQFDLNEWRVITNKGPRSMLVREHWDAAWTKRTVTKAARIALEWSLLPTRQQYAPGDYNWGMTVYGLPPGTIFDLEFRWYQNDQPFTRKIEDIECAPDIHINPQ